MPEQLFGNVASTTLNGAITAVQSVFTVTSSANFPAANTTLEQEFRAAFVDGASPPNILEYFAVTNVSGTSWTVTRQVEDPTRFPAAIRADATRIVMVVTRGVLESFERRSRTVGHNVLDYGAVGNGSHSTSGVGNDDTVAIQDAYDDSRGSTGQAIVIFPGRKTYRITNTITVATGVSPAVQTIGLGSMNGAGLVAQPTIVWNGAEDGVMMSVGTTGPNIPGALFRNINIRGVGPVSDDMTGLPAKAIRFWHESGGTTKIDSGSGLDEVWVQRIKGDAISVETSGLTNWWIRGGRWDQVNGYALYISVKSQSIFSLRDVTYDSWGASFDGHGKGMIHFDAAGGGATAVLFAHLDTFHPEVNSDPIEIDAAGTTPADRRGVIVCTIDPTMGNVNHNLTITNTTLQGGTTLTRSMVLMQGGTTAQRKARLSLSCRNVRGFNGDGTAATGQTIPIGGIPAADKSPYTSASYTRLDFAPGGPGDLFSVEAPNFWTRNTGLPDGILRKAGALVANDFAGTCVVGSLAVDTTNGKLYVCTATNTTTTSTWVVVGTQT